MKKLTAIFIAIVLMASPVYTLAYSKNSVALMPILKELKILNGDEDGNLRLDDFVSRAEFVKMAIASSPFRKTIATNIKVSSYVDVSANHWAAPYIKAAANNNLVCGYSDATFRPDNTVTYEETVTVLLRILGYTDEDFGISWPYGQRGIAEQIGVTKGTEFAVGQRMTRENIATLICNMLICKNKENVDYVQTLGYSLLEDIEIISVDYGNNLYTSQGKFEFQGEIDSSFRGAKGTLIVDKHNHAFCFVSEEKIADFQTSDVGFLCDTGAKTFVEDGKTTKEYYVKIVTPDAEVIEYKADKLYDRLENSVVKITFRDAYAVLQKVAKSNSLNGVFNFEEKSFSGKTMTADIEILDVYSTDSENPSLYVGVYPERIDNVKISADQVLYCEEDEKGRIKKLILKNVTGDMLQYGIMEKAENISNAHYMSGTYKYDIDGTIYELRTSNKIYTGVSSGAPIQVVLDDKGIHSVKALTKATGNLSQLTYSTVRIGNLQYPVSQDVKVYVKNASGTYLIMGLDTLIQNLDAYSVTAYYDKPSQSGGLIRVLVVNGK